MRRLHLIEIHEQAWCPKSIRDAVTDHLQFNLNLLNMYAAIVPRLKRALYRANTRKIIDLCSGAGGPWLTLHGLLRDEDDFPVEICLSDKYPNIPAFERARFASRGAIGFHPKPVDGAQMPAELEGFRTLFTSFHHFRPAEARAILLDAVSTGQGIGAFEITQRSPLAFALMCSAPAFVFLLTPFVRPFRFSRLLWTYLIPVAPFIALLDGLVSCCRTYSPSELRELTDGLGKGGYAWEIGEEKTGFVLIPITYLIGYPAETAQQAPSGTST